MIEDDYDMEETGYGKETGDGEEAQEHECPKCAELDKEMMRVHYAFELLLVLAEDDDSGTYDDGRDEALVDRCVRIVDMTFRKLED